MLQTSGRRDHLNQLGSMTNLSVFVHDFQNKTIRATEDRRFSVYDVLVAFGVTDKAHAQETLKRIQDKHSEVNAFCANFKFSGRGQRLTPVATEEGIYQVLMLCPGKRGAEFRKWAAGLISDPNKALDHAVGKYLRQGRSQEWIETRLKGVITRRQFTDVLKAHGVTGAGYALCTDALNKGITGKSAKQLKAELRCANPRDAMDIVTVKALEFGEILSQHGIASTGANGNAQCKQVCDDAARRVRRVFE